MTCAALVSKNFFPSDQQNYNNVASLKPFGLPSLRSGRSPSIVEFMLI
jgi:hypothetical protein